MTFKPEDVPTFLEMFKSVKSKIEAMPGCSGVELLQQLDQPNVMFTYSNWNDSDDLENYRQSELFKKTWALTKTWFVEKAEAWSVESVS